MSQSNVQNSPLFCCEKCLFSTSNKKDYNRHLQTVKHKSKPKHISTKKEKIFYNYIYLLQEREFIKNSEPVYKVGMTQQVNHERFKQYPKGSVLLFQMKCEDCRSSEKQILTAFKLQFYSKKRYWN